jgi:hypothetical protein
MQPISFSSLPSILDTSYANLSGYVCVYVYVYIMCVCVCAFVYRTDRRFLICIKSSYSQINTEHIGPHKITHKTKERTLFQTAA